MQDDKRVGLGFLRIGDLFEFEDKVYKANSCDGTGYVNCTNIHTNRITKIHVDCLVKKIQRSKNNDTRRNEEISHQERM